MRAPGLYNAGQQSNPMSNLAVGHDEQKSKAAIPFENAYCKKRAVKSML